LDDNILWFQIKIWGNLVIFFKYLAAMSQGWYFIFIKTSYKLLMIILWAMGILIWLFAVMEQPLLD
jgi:hypothetical protein